MTRSAVPRIGPCRDPLRLWFLEYTAKGRAWRRYYADRAEARAALRAWKEGGGDGCGTRAARRMGADGRSVALDRRVSGLPAAARVMSTIPPNYRAWALRAYENYRRLLAEYRKVDAPEHVAFLDAVEAAVSAAYLEGQRSAHAPESAPP